MKYNKFDLCIFAMGICLLIAIVATIASYFFQRESLPTCITSTMSLIVMTIVVFNTKDKKS